MPERHQIRKLNTVLSLLLTCILSSTLLTGCDEVQVFEDPSLKGKMIAVKDDKLEMDTFYVKSGTNFYETIILPGSENVKYAEEYVDTTIPTCYKGELIAQSAAGQSFMQVHLTRFRDLGYGPGLFEAHHDPDTNEVTFMKTSVQQQAHFRKVLESFESGSIRLLTVNGKELDNKHISPNTGVIYNFNKKDEIPITLYAGTYYHELVTLADTELFERMEEYEFDETYISDTQNGYRCFKVPDTLKSGYYMINGTGIFRYVDYERGAGDPETTDYNVPGEENTKAEDNTTKQYSINLDTTMANLRIVAKYDDTEFPDEDKIKGKVLSPDGTEYEMTVDTEENQVLMDLTEAMTGRWQVNISPQDLPITDMTAENITPKQELTEETFTIVTGDVRNNITIVSRYNNVNGKDQKDEVTITGSVIDPEGRTYIMEKGKIDKDKVDYSGQLEADITYAPAGQYTVIINHYPDETTFLEPEITDNIGTSPDILVIEE